MKKSILILGIIFTFPAMALMAQPPKGGGGPGKGGPAAPGPGPHGPGSRDGDPGGAHDDPHRNPLFHVLLHALDTDGDGFISMTEMNHAAESLLALDKNKDGRLSHDELRPGGAAGPKGDKEQEGGDGKKGKGDGGKACAAGKDGAGKQGNGKDGNGKTAANYQPDEHRTALVDAIDTNHDGEIDASEIAAASHALKRLDTSHNGKLGPAEYGGGHAHP
jgi:Ca2+-binding EF-hand superfamily protein